MEVIVTVPFVKGKGRPRFSRYGHAFTPKTTRENENTLKTLMMEVWMREPSKGSFKVEIETFQRKLRTRPDLDNIAKLVLDAGNEIIYEDDAQVKELSIKRSLVVAKEKPHMKISIQENPK